MEIHKRLKPLYSNLKRLNIGEYLSTDEFELYAIENDFDEEWKWCKENVSNNKDGIEEAFLYLSSYFYNDFLTQFDKFLFPILLNYTKWNKYKLDLTLITKNLKELGIDKDSILGFIKSYRIEINKKLSKPNMTERGTKREILDRSKVFIVHGHDELAKSEVARFIEKLNLTPIILHEQANSGYTIIEKIEKYSDVGFGIVLYTPCDEGAKKGSDNFQDRARQNVVFEHGFLIGKINRKNVSALVKGNLETPNDISGVVYTDMDTSGAWKFQIANDMRKSGYNIDLNLLQIG
jgi:predicted nucleotide-binding protein